MSHYPQVRLANSNSLYGRWLNKLFDRFIAPLMQLRPFQRAYSKALHDPAPTDLWTKTLQQLNTTLDISDSDLARIPRTGPLIVVANHPHGIMDGVLLGSLMHRVRDDFKIIMNEATTMPGLEDSLFFVSLFSSAKENAKKNMQIMRQALEWLDDGHAVLVFPAGEISAINAWHETVALDNIWNTSIIRLSQRSKAPVLPLLIMGQNDNWFLKLGLIHPVLRTLQIGRVTNQLLGTTMTVRATQPIAGNLLNIFKDDAAKLDFIRGKMYSLISRQSPPQRIFDEPLSSVINTHVTVQQVQAAFELLNAQPCFKVRENDPYVVLLFNQQQLLEFDPSGNTFSVLKDEIGRLRELTFRAVSEGSGKSRDLDRFDEFHSHLTLWDRQQKRIIGAYRIAFTEDTFPKYGVEGLYTSLQFDYNPAFFETIGPAIELSRAFIVKEHQKTNMSLSTLLGALCQVLMSRPNIRSFFGAVSISNGFQSVSKKLMVDFLTQYHGYPKLSSWVRPKNPPELGIQMPEKEWQRLLNTVCDLSLLKIVVSGIEEDGKSVPPLIPAYLSLMGRFVAFDHDIEFNSIDGLLVINMKEAVAHNSTMIKRLMGKGNFDAYQQQL